MPHLRAVPSMAPAPAREVGSVRPMLYKADYPRAIDRHIDFFGGGAPRGDVTDRCGDLFLESLA
jgi:hypothetical protein